MAGASFLSWKGLSVPGLVLVYCTLRKEGCKILHLVCVFRHFSLLTVVFSLRDIGEQWDHQAFVMAG